MKEEVSRCLSGAAYMPRVETVWNPIDLQHFAPLRNLSETRVRLGIDPQGNHVSILGAIAPHKGHICFLRMAKEVLRDYPSTTFHIIGGPMGRGELYLNDLRHLAATLGIANQVRFWGFAPALQARDLLAASDLFVLPTSEEGFGLVLGEAQACQVPVLSSRIRPLDEVVDDGRTGFLHDRDDHLAFAATARALLASPERRLTVGAAGRRWVQQRFSTSAFIDCLLALYENLLCAEVGRTCRQ
jgi:glycosyltransferase involved in cell wall biosynthesis